MLRRSLVSSEIHPSPCLASWSSRESRSSPRLLFSLPLHRYVIANDLSPTAAEAMRRNVEFNEVGPSSEKPAPVPGAKVVEGEVWEGRVKVREGDAW